MADSDARLAVVADDNDDARMLVSSAARRLGFAVREASSGSELLGCVRDAWAHDEKVALVISDIGMPEGDGIDVTRTLLASNPQLHVVLMTAFGDQATVKRAREAGALHVLRKPFSLAALDKVLEELPGVE